MAVVVCGQILGHFGGEQFPADALLLPELLLVVPYGTRFSGGKLPVNRVNFFLAGGLGVRLDLGTLVAPVPAAISFSRPAVACFVS